ncbi:MAG: enoyl-CoA hydratase/isomerase family protein [Chloroflexi bacterium]|nr:enoyl-CoA hydratase/isomerase family protein [Chloroflexota bacterium]
MSVAPGGTDAGRVEHSVHDGVATIALTQPSRRNAMTLAMWDQLRDVANSLDAQEDVHVVVLRGAGHEAFSAGADISEFEALRSTAALALEYNRHVSEALDVLAGLEKPLIGMIYGVCVGGGCEIALTCDLRLASDSAQFGIPASRLGISVNLDDVKRLVDLVGPSNARLILYTGNPRFPASRALQMGLIDELAPREELETRIYELAREIARAAPLSVRWAKEAIAEILVTPDVSTIPNRDERAAALFGTEDFREGAAAFLEKRPPRFRGR